MLPFVLDAAQAQAPTNVIWWTLLRYYTFLGFAAGTIVVAWMVHGIVKYRASKVKEAPKFHEESGWGNWKSVVLTLLVTGTVLGFVEYQTFAGVGLVVSPSGDPININVIGRQFTWEFIYPNGAITIGNLTVPVNQQIVLNVTSVDVDHAFSIPMLSIAKDALPGQYNTLWFNATSAGFYKDAIVCKELCGVGHALMLAGLNVTTNSTYTKFLTSIAPPPPTNSSSSSGSSGGPSSAGVTVAMPQNIGDDQSLNFQPASVTVVVGVNNTINFVDQDSQSGAPHNVHWLTQPAGAGAKDSPVTMSAGQSFTVTLTAPGTYTYDCSIHPGWMKGTITVKAS